MTEYYTNINEYVVFSVWEKAMCFEIIILHTSNVKLSMYDYMLIKYGVMQKF